MMTFLGRVPRPSLSEEVRPTATWAKNRLVGLRSSGTTNAYASPRIAPGDSLHVAAACDVRRERRVKSEEREPGLELPPLVYRDGLAVAGAEDAPVGVGFAADDDHLDLVALEHADHLVGRGLEHGSVRLLAVGRARIDVILDELIVPVLTRGHARVVADPVDQLVLRVEPAAIDELTRGDRIEHKRRMLARVHAAQHVAHVVLPVRLAQTEREGSVPATAKHTHRAILGLEPVRNVERLPGAALLVLRKGDAVVGVVVAL